jgi:hypothetical protein
MARCFLRPNASRFSFDPKSKIPLLHDSLSVERFNVNEAIVLRCEERFRIGKSVREDAQETHPSDCKEPQTEHDRPTPLASRIAGPGALRLV